MYLLLQLYKPLLWSGYKTANLQNIEKQNDDRYKTANTTNERTFVKNGELTIQNNQLAVFLEVKM